MLCRKKVERLSWIDDYRIVHDHRGFCLPHCRRLDRENRLDDGISLGGVTVWCFTCPLEWVL